VGHLPEDCISPQLSILDLFIAGLGVEVFGGYLVAKGLLLSSSALKVFGTNAGIGIADVVDRVKSRVDAKFGMTFLIVGFVLQLIGYFLQLDGDQSVHGQRLLVSAIALFAIAVGAAYVFWRSLRDRLFKRGLVAVAAAPLLIGEHAVEESHEKRVEWLALYGKAAQWAALPYESDETYVRRVFGKRVTDSM
jgi:hypothetical protein